ncbi:MAG TPA: T9SS type A sorting domain-containing protein [Saprospiraceae bacterium]|nr:T9SS type A sorting domain-containing protein [Saprospiraceae bacterium]
MRDSFMASGYYTNYEFIKANHLPSIQVDGAVEFTIPGRTGDHQASAYRVEYTDSLDYLWMGLVKGEEPGYLMIVREEYGTVGFIQTEEKFYSILPVQFEYALMFEYANGPWNVIECGNTNGGGPSSQPDLCGDEYNICATTIDALILISAPARTWLDQFRFLQVVGFPPQIVVRDLSPIVLRLMGETMNVALQLSDIPNKRFRYRFEEFQFAFNNPQNIDVDLADLRSGAGPNDAPARRDANRSDIVVMYTQRGYTDISGRRIFGLAGTLDPNEALSYAIVEIPFALAPRWTHSHEIGHLFGALHNRTANGGNDDTDRCTHGWQFQGNDGNDRRTILAASAAINPADPQRRILHFSNPDVLVDGVDSGTEDNNNARSIRNAGCYIGNFMIGPNFNAFIISQSAACTGDIVEMTALVIPALQGFPGHPPFTFEWRWNTSGIFTPTSQGWLIGYDETENLEFPDEPQIFIQLKVMTNDGFTFVYTHHVRRIEPELCPLELVQLPNYTIRPDLADLRDSEINFNLYPNPSTHGEYIHIHFSEQDDSIAQMTLYNVHGVILHESTCTLEDFEIQLLGIQPGAYFVRIAMNSKVGTDRIIIQ